MGKLLIVKLWRRVFIRLRKSLHTSKKSQFTLEIEMISP